MCGGGRGGWGLLIPIPIFLLYSPIENGPTMAKKIAKNCVFDRDKNERFPWFSLRGQLGPGVSNVFPSEITQRLLYADIII